MKLLLVITSVIVSSAQFTLAEDSVLRSRERNSISLELEFTRRKPDSLQRLVAFIEREPNAYATAFFVGPRLVLTAYHAVSGQLDYNKRLALGFSRDEDLEVKVYANGCRANLISVDKEADLALLEVCGSTQPASLAFQSTIEKDEKVMLVAKPQGRKIVGYGTFYGPYAFSGIDYWSIRINAADGFSGSPVYNSRGEIIGVFSGYDWTQKLAIVSPGNRAQKLLDGFRSHAKRNPAEP